MSRFNHEIYQVLDMMVILYDCIKEEVDIGIKAYFFNCHDTVECGGLQT